MSDPESESGDEFDRSWTAAAVRHATLKEVVDCLKADAGEAFANGRDDEAKLTRSLAQKIDALRVVAEQQLGKYIEANRARTARPPREI